MAAAEHIITGSHRLGCAKALQAMKRERFASRVGLGMAVTEVGLEEDVKSHSTNTLCSLC